MNLHQFRLALWVCAFVFGCSKDESAPPPVVGCSPMPDNIACERSSGKCVPLQCVDENWECAPGEDLVVLTPGQCRGVQDAGADAGEEF